jgi:chromosome segregation ATPase
VVEIPKTGDPEVDAFVIILVCLIIAVLVGLRVSKVISGKIEELQHAVHLVGNDAREAKHQVKNDHRTNLRDDLDRIRDKLSTIETGMKSSNTAMLEIRNRLDDLQREQANQGKKQRDMEDTLTRSLDDQSELKKDIGGLRADNRHTQTRLDRVVDTVVLNDRNIHGSDD